MLAVAGCLLGFMACSPPEDDTIPATDFDENSGAMVSEPPKAFWAKGFSLTHLDGNKRLLAVHADHVIHRRRVTQWITYENYDEIFVKALAVHYPVPENRARQPLNLPLQDLGDDLKSLQSMRFEPKEPDAQPDVLSRVLVEGVSFQLIPPGQSPIELSAEEAKISGDFSAIQLEGTVVLRGARCRLEAPLALWSSHHAGLLFPDGYTRKHRYHPRAVFILVRSDGSCRETKPIPPVAYVDFLEEQESRFLGNLTRKMLAYVRFMLGVGVVPEESKH